MLSYKGKPSGQQALLMSIHSILAYLQRCTKSHTWKKLISQQWLCEETVIWLCNQIAMCSVSRCEQIKRKPNLDFVPIALLYACLFLRTPYDFFLICLVVATCSMVLYTFRLQHCDLPTDGMMHFNYSVSLQQDDCVPVHL